MFSNTPCRPVAGSLKYALGLALLCTGTFVPAAKADFVTPYALSDFTLVNSANANGTATTPDNGRTVVFTGPNDGSGLPGFTELTVVARGTGLFQFDYVYTSLDVADVDFAGYLVNGHFFPLATSSGQSGTISVPVNIGDHIGFRIDTLDNIAEPGVLTISKFSAPRPAPVSVPALSTTATLILALLLSSSGLVLMRRQRKSF
jgi:hypothetical protein